MIGNNADAGGEGGEGGFFFNDTATTEIYTLSLHDALPIFTKRPAETRMGKGKGAVDTWVASVHPGRVLYEIDGVPEEVATEALRLAAYKLSINTKIIKRAAVI